MELRTPPQTAASSGKSDRSSRGLLWSILLLTLGILTWLVLMRVSDGSQAVRAATQREVASKLLAAGAADEAAELYEEVLAGSRDSDDAAPRIAYSLGKTYLANGRYDKALRWFYESEVLGPGDLADEVSSGIVNALERLGRVHAAQSALDSRAKLGSDVPIRADSDVVVAKIGNTEIRRSEVERALDDLPAELASAFAGPQGRQRFLDKYVADELLWRKAAKLAYDRDPEVLRRQEEALKQLAVARFVEEEVLSDLKIDETDLRNYFEANRDRYEKRLDAGGEGKEITFEKARPMVEAEYRMMKLQSMYDDLIASELSAQEVEIFKERMNEDS